MSLEDSEFAFDDFRVDRLDKFAVSGSDDFLESLKIFFMKDNLMGESPMFECEVLCRSSVGLSGHESTEFEFEFMEINDTGRVCIARNGGRHDVFLVC